MKKILSVDILGSTVLSLAVFTPVFAKQWSQNGTNYSVPPAQNSTGQTNGTNTTTQGTQDDGISPWWLLPLLAIPVLYFHRRDNKDEDDRRYYDQGMSGAKGGKSRRDRNEDE